METFFVEHIDDTDRPDARRHRQQTDVCGRPIGTTTNRACRNCCNATMAPAQSNCANPARPSTAARALLAYFEGDLNAVDELPTETNGTAFQRAVWTALRKIPAGRTVSYGALAAQIGNHKAVRAVGLANGANPIAIVVPCHRVIGANASLTGYGGGLHRKRWLLAHERGDRPLFAEARPRCRAINSGFSTRAI